MVFRFRVTYEDHEDVYRDIEIKSSQSFADFHLAIQQAIGFDNSKSASFYSSDDYWRKEKELAIENAVAEPQKGKNKKSAEEELKKKKTIAAFVESPHQRFIYIFDPEKEWTFTIELLKIIPEDNSSVYPKCIKSIGNAPKQYKPVNLPTPPAEEEDDDKPEIKKEKKKSIKKEAEEQAPIVLEKEPSEEEMSGFIPLDEDGIEEINEEENASGEENEEISDEEEPSDEDLNDSSEEQSFDED